MHVPRSLLICLSDIANSLNKRVNVDDIRLKLSILLEKEVVLVLQTSIGSFSQKNGQFLAYKYPLRSLYLIVVHVFIYRFSVMCMLLVFTETNYTK